MSNTMGCVRGYNTKSYFKLVVCYYFPYFYTTYIICSYTIDSSEKSLEEGTTLTTTDKTGYSAITSMLFSGDEKIQSAFDSYLAKIPIPINKVEATEKDFKNIVTMLEYPQLDGLDLDTCLQNYIATLYSASCLGNISEIFGLD